MFFLLPRSTPLNVMRFTIIAAVFAVAAAVSLRVRAPPTVVTTTEAAKMTRPIMVDSLNEAKQGGVAPPYSLATADALLGGRVPGLRRERALGAHVNSDLKTLQSQMQEQATTLQTLQQQLSEGYKQKRRLQLAQRLMAGILQMNRAERAR